MAKWQTGPINFGSRNKRKDNNEDQGDMGLTFLARDKRVCEGTERMYKDPDGPDHRKQTWDDYVNKAGRARGVKCETYDATTGATADGHVGYLDRRRAPGWDDFVDKKTPGKVEERQVEMVTSRRENAVIERMNVNMNSDNEENEEKSDDEGKGPGTAVPIKLLSYAEHQKIKLDRLFDKCKDEEGGVQGKPVYMAVMPSKIPERDVNVVREAHLNIMGSCAGAGSGEFHAFRKSRRKEYARQSILKYREIRDKNIAEHKDKVDTQKSLEDSKTAKKRAKRQRAKDNKKNKEKPVKEESSEESSDESAAEDQKEEAKPPPADPYEDPLMKHPKAAPVVIAGDFSVDMAASADALDTPAAALGRGDTDSDTDSDY